MQYLLIYTLIGSIALAVFAGLLRLPYLSKGYALLMLQLLIALATEITGRYVRLNTTVYNIYIAQEMLWLGLAARHLLNSVPIRRFLLFCQLACMAIWIYNWTIVRPHQFMNISFLSNCIFLLTAFLCVLLETATQSSRLWSQPLFWISLGHILYFGCDIPYFSFYDYFTFRNQNLGKLLFNINNIAAPIRYLIVAAGLFLLKGAKRNG